MLSEREQTLWTALDAIDAILDVEMEPAAAVAAIHFVMTKRQVVHQMVAFHEEWKAEFGEDCYPRMYGE